MTQAQSTRWITAGLSVYAALSLVSMAAMSVGAGTLLLCLLVAWGGRGFFKNLGAEASRPWTRKYLWIAGVLALACALSLLVGLATPLGYGGKSVDIHFFKDMAKVWYLAWPWILVTSLRSLPPRNRKTVLGVWLGVFGVLSLVGVAQYFTGWPRPQMIPGNEPYFHATLFLGHHLSVASVWIFPFFVTLDLLKSRRELPLPRSVLWGCAVSGLLTLFATYSRTLWVALPVGTALWALLSLPRKRAGLFVACLLVATLGISQIPAVKKRVVTAIGIGTRQELWLANLEFIKERPLTGVGWHHNLELSGYYFHSLHPEQSEFFTGHAHNNILEVLGGTGMLGLLAWLLYNGFIFRALWQLSKQTVSHDQNFARGLLCAWVVFQINGLTQVNFWESKVLHQMMFVIAWSLLGLEQRLTEQNDKPKSIA